MIMPWNFRADRGSVLGPFPQFPYVVVLLKTCTTNGAMQLLFNYRVMILLLTIGHLEL